VIEADSDDKIRS
jgi:MFS transporter, FLVCR family, feline leukemia virus subgroup C receptor-related protein